MKNGVAGIFLNKITHKYDVRLNRKSVTYNIGKFTTYEEAVLARAAFLEEYAIGPPQVYIEQYSKEWWKQEAKKQREKFKELSL